MEIHTVGKLVRERRLATGLTQARLARLADLSRQTVQRLEAGTIADLSWQRVAGLLRVLGLGLEAPSLAARHKKRGLWMAAKSSSVSYRGELSEAMLEQALASGEVPVGYAAHLGHFLDEVAVEVVVMAVEETAVREDVAPAQVWGNVARLARTLGCARAPLWAA